MDRDKFESILNIARTLVHDYKSMRGFTMLDKVEQEAGVDFAELLEEFGDWLEYEYED